MEPGQGYVLEGGMCCCSGRDVTVVAGGREEKHLSNRNRGYKRPLETSNPIKLDTGVLPALGHVGCDFVFLSLEGLQG